MWNQARAWLAALALSSAAGAAVAAAQADDAAVKVFLRTYLSPPAPGAEAANPTRVSIAWVDLNGDGSPEALAQLRSGSYCGSGGCNMLVLQRTAEGFQVRGNLTVSRAPVGVLPDQTRGWRDLTVFVAGGGIPGHVAVVPFGAEHYAQNPTTPPAHALRAGQRPRVLIPREDKGEMLYRE